MSFRLCWPPLFPTSILSSPFLSRVFPALCRGNPAGMPSLLLSSKILQHLGCASRGRGDEKRASEQEKKVVYCRRGERWDRWGGKWVVFSCSQPVLLMYTPKQPEAHSSQSQWLTWQSAWQPLCTLEIPLRLDSRPVLPRSPPSPPYPLPWRRPPLPTTQPSISHAKAHLAPQDQAFNFCQPVSLWCQWFWKHTPRHETGTRYAAENTAHLHSTFLNKNDRRGESSLCERSPLDWSKNEKWEEEQCRGADPHSAVLYWHSCTQTHVRTHYSFSLPNS